MYAVTAEVGELWGRLFAYIGDQAGLDLEIVSHAAPAPLADLWRREDKAAVFMCGLPYSLETFPAQLLVAPVPSPTPFAGRPLYWSELVVHRDSGFRKLADTFGHRVAFTVPDSQSGYAAPVSYLSGVEGCFPRFREIIAPRITPLGALSAVIDGTADLAPVDSYAFALLGKYRPELIAQVRIVAQTRPTPIPPLVCSPGSFDALRSAFLSAHRQTALKPILQALLLERFTLPEPAAYDTLRTTFEQSRTYWRGPCARSARAPYFCVISFRCCGGNSWQWMVPPGWWRSSCIRVGACSFGMPLACRGGSSRPSARTS